MLSTITSKIIIEELKKIDPIDRQLIIDEIVSLKNIGPKNDKGTSKNTF